MRYHAILRFDLERADVRNIDPRDEFGRCGVKVDSAGMHVNRVIVPELNRRIRVKTKRSPFGPGERHPGFLSGDDSLPRMNHLQIVGSSQHGLFTHDKNRSEALLNRGDLNLTGLGEALTDYVDSASLADAWHKFRAGGDAEQIHSACVLSVWLQESANRPVVPDRRFG